MWQSLAAEVLAERTLAIHPCLNNQYPVVHGGRGVRKRRAKIGDDNKVVELTNSGLHEELISGGISSFNGPTVVVEGQTLTSSTTSVQCTPSRGSAKKGCQDLYESTRSYEDMYTCSHQMSWYV
ncbi:hypothetical protein R1flu_004210 [Riccia fluitans]|uniref:Uncharacterized protein n=1 Tax=Riccia fluitans TaxID=41844 RepID=A0ABD1YPL7_9MARC